MIENYCNFMGEFDDVYNQFNLDYCFSFVLLRLIVIIVIIGI